MFSKRIVERTGSKSKEKISAGGSAREMYPSLGRRPVPRALPPAGLAVLQRLHWDNVGIIRDKEGLSRAAAILAAWQQSLRPPTDQPSYELSNLILTGRLLTEAAFIREESRGAHFRSDFPRSSPKWQCNIIWKK